MLPLYKRLGMSRLVLACVIMLAGGVFNILPWGGPTARAASALGVDPREVFVPMIPPMIVAIIWVLFVSYLLGMRERKRVGVIDFNARAASGVGDDLVASTNSAIARPKLLWVNFALTVALMVMLMLGVLPLPVLFMIFFAIGIMINYPKLSEQKERIAAHAENVLPVVSLIFAAGIFVGILSGTKWWTRSPPASSRSSRIGWDHTSRSSLVC